MASPSIPGALNLSALTGDEIIPIAPIGPKAAQTTAQAIAALAGQRMPPTTTIISAANYVTASDPAGIQGALDYASTFVPTNRGSIRIDVAAGVFNYTTPIVANLAAGLFVLVQGTLATADTLDPVPIPVGGMVNNGDGSWDVTYKYLVAGSGTAVGRPKKFRALPASYTGPERGKELAGPHMVVALDTAAKTYTVRIWDRGGIGLDTGLENQALHFTDIRGNRTALNFALTRLATDQGGFTVGTGTELYVNALALMGNRTASGVPSTGAPTAAGTADTAGILLNPCSVVRCGSAMMVLGWGGNGVQQLAGSTIDWLDESIANCYQNGVYPQQNATTNVARAVISGCHINSAGTLNSQVEIPDSICVLGDYGSQCTGGSMTYFGGSSYIGSNLIALYNDDSFTDAEGSDLVNNTTDVVIPKTGLVRYTDSGNAVVRQNYVGPVAGLPAYPSPGLRCTVTDSNATLTAGIGAIVADGGANTVPVVGDGVNWRIG